MKRVSYPLALERQRVKSALRAADPIGAIWSGALMLEHLGHQAAASAIIAAIEQVLGASPGVRTPSRASESTFGRSYVRLTPVREAPSMDVPLDREPCCKWPAPALARGSARTFRRSQPQAKPLLPTTIHGLQEP